MQFGAYRESLELQEKGTPFRAEGWADGTAIYVKRWGTKESEKHISEIRMVVDGPYGARESFFPDIVAHWLAGYGVTGWEGVYDDDGVTLLPFTKETARQVFLDDGHKLNLNMMLYGHAINGENYYEELARRDSEEIKK